MVRTKADGTRKAVAAKAPRKVLASSSGSSASMMSPKSGKASKYAGGNLYNPQPTPDWQKGIGMFLSPGKPREKSGKENEAPTDEIEVMEIGEPSGASGSSTACSSSSSSSASASGPSGTPTSSKSPQTSPQSSPESSPKKKSPIEDYSDEDE